MARIWRMKVLSLMVCVSVLSGCDDDSAANETAARDHAARNYAATQGADLLAQRAEDASAGDVTPAPADSESRVLARTAPPLVSGTVAASGRSTAELPAEAFRARIVEVAFSPEGETLFGSERAVARARAFGLEWRERHYAEVENMLHSKSPKRGCGVSRSKMYYSLSADTVSTMKMSGHRGTAEEPYSVGFDYLGSRDGKDHYLLSFTVEEGAASARLAGQGMRADWRSTERRADELDRFTEVKTVTYADGSTEVTRTRRASYELVYGGEPFFLKLADRMLLHFGGRGIERYSAEELAAMDQGRKGTYRPCPNCALSDEMAVDELRIGAGGLTVVLPF